MLEIKAGGRFKRDLKLAAKRGCDFSAMESVVDRLRRQEPLPEKHHDHALSGEYEGCRECHISPDWLLVYKISNVGLILYLLRTGTHSDLF